VSSHSSDSTIFVDGAPLSADENTSPMGGLWVLQAEGYAQIVELIEGDPLYRADLRSYQIFATGKRLNIS
jgi:hypothetical protein